MKAASALAMLLIFDVTPSSAQDRAAPGAWTNVRELTPGTPALVTVCSAAPAGRFGILEVSDSQLTLFSLASATDRESRALLETATHHTQFFIAPSGRRAYVDARTQVRVAPDGVFVAGRRIGGLDETVRQISRRDVMKVERVDRRGSIGWTILAAVGGFYAGGSVGAAITRNSDQDDAVLAGAMVGAPIGAIAGAIAGYLVSRHDTTRLVYYVPSK